jgi:ABC-type amino acid transport substrate-binding protein
MRRALALITLMLATAACGGATSAPEGAPTTPAEAPGDAATAPPATGGLGGRVLHVGTDATYPPFESMTAENTIEGIDPSLMEAICGLANCVAQFENTAWDGIFGALKAGEFAVLMSAITLLPEREENSGGRFTEPYFEVGQVLLAAAGDTTITDTESLSAPGVKVGVQTGTTGDTAAGEAGVGEDAISRFDTIALAVAALLNGDVDVVVVDNPTAEVYLERHAGELQIVGEPFTTEQYGILVPAEDADVLEALNAAIVRLRADGTIDAIVAEWYAKD